MNDNKIVGNQLERIVCRYLSDCGFWAHNMAQSAAGQPADIIAVRHTVAHLIDCKDCRSGSFAVSRIEPNQWSGMDVWRQTGNGHGWFAVRFGPWIYMADIQKIDKCGKSTLKESWFKSNGIPLDEWVVSVP